MTGSDHPPPFRLDGWRIEPSLNRLIGDDRLIQIEPRVMQVLCRLASAPGRVFSRQELLDTVWSEVTVGEEALTRAIAELRKAFGDNAKSSRVIETIYKGGYRLLLPATPVETEATFWSTEASPPAARCAPPRRKRRLVGLSRLAAAPAAAAGVAIAAAVGWATLMAPGLEAKRSEALRLTPLTSFSGEEVMPALSPDGERLAFSWRRPGEKHFALYVKTVPDGEPTRVAGADSHFLSPSWSPDASSLAVIRKGGGECEILSISAASGERRFLSRCGTDGQPRAQWNPDGSSLLIVDKESATAPYRLSLLRLTDGTKSILTSPDVRTLGDEIAAFSPDGKRVAFVRSAAFGISDIYVVPAEGGRERRVTHDALKVRGLDWSGDGDSILFSSNRTGESLLWRANERTGETSLVPLGSEAFGVSEASRSNRVAFERRTADMNIWTVDLPPRNDAVPEAIVSSTRWDAYPEYSPGGEMIAFASDRSGTPEIYISDADGANARQVTRMGRRASQSFSSPPQFSSRGTATSGPERLKPSSASLQISVRTEYGRTRSRRVDCPYTAPFTNLGTMR